jgi:hypothetical protein
MATVSPVTVAMTFKEVLDQAIARRQHRGRLTYSTLKRQFQLKMPPRPLAAVRFPALSRLTDIASQKAVATSSR